MVLANTSKSVYNKLNARNEIVSTNLQGFEQMEL